MDFQKHKFFEIYLQEKSYRYQIQFIYNLGLDMITKETFLGEFKEEHYTVTKSYVPTELKHVELYHIRYAPNNPKRTVVIVHGLGERTVQYHETADFLAKNECEVVIADQRGCGYSGGPRYTQQIRDLQNDLYFMMKTVRSDLPVFIFGHSLGGLITTRFMLDFPKVNVSGCVLDCPALGLAKQLNFNPIKRKVIQFLGTFLADFSVNVGLGVTAITSKKQKIFDIFEQSMFNGTVSTKMMASILTTLDDLKKDKHRISFPLLIFLGEKDTLVDNASIKEFVAANTHPNSQYHVFPGGYHEPKYEDKDEMFKRTLNFIKGVQQAKPISKIEGEPLRPIKKSSMISTVFLLSLLVLLMARIIGFI